MTPEMIRFLGSVVLAHYLLNYCQCGTLPASQQAEQTLIKSLLTGYEKNIRPDHQVSVDITATLQQIVAIDEKQQIMTSSSFISQTWFDDRLSWTPNASNNYTEVVMLPVKSLWIPDTMILNSADANGYLTVSDYSLASVDNLGQVYMILPALTIRTRCSLLVLKFPFDKQVCSINITSWSQGNNRIIYTENDSLVIDTSGYNEHPLWQLTGTDMIVYHAADRAPFEDTYNDVISIQLYLQRKPLFFILNGIFACLVLNVVTLLSYTLPFATQISLCMVCFMTYSVYSLNFSNLFPQQSQYLMMITLYFLLSIGWTAVSMAWFVICNHLTSKGEMPRPLYAFCGWLQRIRSCNFLQTKDNISTAETQDITTQSIESKKSENENIFTSYSRRRVGTDSMNTKQQDSIEDIHSINRNVSDAKPIETLAYISVQETNKKEKPKCHFCNRCESCQADFDKDKTKGKNKKDIEARCNALNYFVFAWIFVFMLASNMAVWFIMSR